MRWIYLSPHTRVLERHNIPSMKPNLSAASLVTFYPASATPMLTWLSKFLSHHHSLWASTRFSTKCKERRSSHISNVCFICVISRCPYVPNSVSLRLTELTLFPLLWETYWDSVVRVYTVREHHISAMRFSSTCHVLSLSRAFPLYWRRPWCEEVRASALE